MFRVIIVLVGLFSGSTLQAAIPLLLNVKPVIDAGRIIVVGETNLPDGADLMITVSRKESSYSGQDKTKVVNGKFRAGPFTNRGQPLMPGKYLVRVSGPGSGVQPAGVRDAVGKEYSNFSGPALKKTQFGVLPEVQVVAVVTGPVDAKADAAARIQKTGEVWAWRKEQCMKLADTAGALSGTRPTSAQRQKITRDCLAEVESDRRKAESGK